MDISAITATTVQGSNKDGLGGLADDFDNFLKLLTTQLQNQDPTSPMDADQFTQQLVQFSGVEQQIRSNETLNKLTTIMQADQLGQAVGYIGAEVDVESAVFQLGGDGTAKLHYELEGNANSVLVKISDEFGRIVALKPGENSAGQHSLTWDGYGDNGTKYTDGSFKIDIIAENATGSPVAASTMISGTVDSVEMDGAETMLSVNGILMSLGLVTAIRQPVEAT